MVDKPSRFPGLIVGSVAAIIFVFLWIFLIAIALVVGTGPWVISGIVIVIVVEIFLVQHLVKSVERRGYPRPLPVSLLMGSFIGLIFIIAGFYAVSWWITTLAAK